ncbi:LolA family protein [Minwuia sp.]|uniref:LolA family protein n=1 Tax=Minwuia sp. TaxID=2493630 RepID=UPI003A9491F4
MISRLLGILVALLLLAGPAFALTQEERTQISEAETYLESIETLQADFVQQAQNGATAEGRLLMQRPGLIRFQYDPPAKILLISDGTLVSFIDYEVGQLTQWPLFDTPLSYLVRDDVDLLNEALVDQVETEPGVLRFRMRDPDRAEQGWIRFHFATEPMRLLGWQLTDAQDQETTVALTNLTVNRGLPDNAFRYETPKAPWATER